MLEMPKKGANEFRAIADARHGNKGLDKWGVSYFQSESLWTS